MSEVKVIELNPFMVTTDGALFSWEHERDLLEGADKETIFRITERPKIGSTSMLPLNLRALMKSEI